MRPANLHDVPEFLRFCFKRRMQNLQSRDQMVLQLFGGADVNR